MDFLSWKADVLLTYIALGFCLVVLCVTILTSPTKVLHSAILTSPPKAYMPAYNNVHV